MMKIILALALLMVSIGVNYIISIPINSILKASMKYSVSIPTSSPGIYLVVNYIYNDPNSKMNEYTYTVQLSDAINTSSKAFLITTGGLIITGNAVTTYSLSLTTPTVGGVITSTVPDGSYH